MHVLHICTCITYARAQPMHVLNLCMCSTYAHICHLSLVLMGNHGSRDIWMSVAPFLTIESRYAAANVNHDIKQAMNKFSRLSTSVWPATSLLQLQQVLSFPEICNVSISALHLGDKYTYVTFRTMVTFAMKHLPSGCELLIDNAWISPFIHHKYGRGNIGPDAFPHQHECQVVFGPHCCKDPQLTDASSGPLRMLFQDNAGYQWKLKDASPLTPCYCPGVPLFQLDTYNPFTILNDFDIGRPVLDITGPLYVFCPSNINNHGDGTILADLRRSNIVEPSMAFSGSNGASLDDRRMSADVSSATKKMKLHL